ncbi:hypothetical protein CVT26_001126 [Gymnopilus dilepis]|uniref:Uncharacterized protein n=1 Tax=Gymnopilus dilepis TaxID=231916 RepID=A0A409X7R4_9AGAR|nr:hypothetical protein CVT26_001126 [Gymnopilus dilepis]
MAETEKLAEQHDKERECVVDFSAQLVSLALVVYGGRFINCILHAANFVITGGNFTQVLGDFNLVEQHGKSLFLNVERSLRSFNLLSFVPFLLLNCLSAFFS